MIRSGGNITDRCRLILIFPASSVIAQFMRSFTAVFAARCLFMVSCRCRDKRILSQRRNAPPEPFFCDFPIEMGKACVVAAAPRFCLIRHRAIYALFFRYVCRTSVFLLAAQLCCAARAAAERTVPCTVQNEALLRFRAAGAARFRRRFLRTAEPCAEKRAANEWQPLEID